jgi:hypothetical protein
MIKARKATRPAPESHRLRMPTAGKRTRRRPRAKRPKAVKRAIEKRSERPARRRSSAAKRARRSR